MDTFLPLIEKPQGFSRKLAYYFPALMDECFAKDDVLRKNGPFAGREALQSAQNATTLRWKDGKVSITDGPYAETKEQLGGILVLEARDLNHAIQLMSEHPGGNEVYDSAVLGNISSVIKPTSPSRGSCPLGTR
ncbi:MAG: YciI family protein [Gammaproteobacteria bacterium]